MKRFAFVLLLAFALPAFATIAAPSPDIVFRQDVGGVVHPVSPLDGAHVQVLSPGRFDLRLASDTIGPALPAAPTGNLLLAMLFQVLVPILGTVLTAALGFVGNAARTWAAGKAYEQAVASLTLKIEALVHHAEAVLRPKVQLALADGVLSPAEAADLKGQVLVLVKESAGAEISVLTQRFGIAGPIVDKVLSGLIERAVLAMSAQQAMPQAVDAPAPAAVVVQGERSNSDDPQVG